MAYLRGNTYVDGALNVEGSLIIDSVASSSGNVPFYTDTSVKSKTDSIIKVNNTNPLKLPVIALIKAAI